MLPSLVTSRPAASDGQARHLGSGHAKSASRPPVVTVSDSGDYDQAIGNPHKSWERDRPDDSQGGVVGKARRQEGNGTKSLSGVERQRSPDESRDRTKPVPPRQPAQAERQDGSRTEATGRHPTAARAKRPPFSSGTRCGCRPARDGCQPGSLAGHLHRGKKPQAGCLTARRPRLADTVVFPLRQVFRPESRQQPASHPVSAARKPRGRRPAGSNARSRVAPVAPEA